MTKSKLLGMKQGEPELPLDDHRFPLKGCITVSLSQNGLVSALPT